MTDSGAPGSWRVVMLTVTPLIVPRLEQMLANFGHKLVGVLTAPGPRSRRTDDYLQVAQLARPGLDVIISNTPSRWATMISALRPDLLICATFNWKIPDDVLALPRLGTINLHDSLLPLQRGRNATGWTLRKGVPHGVTVHYMVTDLDAGPILAQREVPISDDDLGLDTIFPRFAAASAECLVEALMKVAAGDPGTPQDESLATYAKGAFEPEWREIDWSDTARENFVKVRSWYGFRDVPRGAFGDIDGQRCLIKTTRLTVSAHADAAPGTVLERRGDGSLLIQCGDGPLEVLDWEPAKERAEG